MTEEEATNQMAINNEIAVSGRLEEYLSYKEMIFAQLYTYLDESINSSYRD